MFTQHKPYTEGIPARIKSCCVLVRILYYVFLVHILIRLSKHPYASRMDDPRENRIQTSARHNTAQ